MPPAGPGAEPLVRGSGGEAPQEAESFLFHFFSEARAEIKRFDRFEIALSINRQLDVASLFVVIFVA